VLGSICNWRTRLAFEPGTRFSVLPTCLGTGDGSPGVRLDSDTPPFEPLHLLGRAFCQLIHAAQELEPSHSLRPHTYATLIGLMASCGLRMGKALRLTDTDVRLADSQSAV